MRYGRRERRSRLHDPVANRVTHEITDRAEMQLPHDVRAVGLDCLDADTERRRRLFGPPSFGNELNDPALAGRHTDWGDIGLGGVAATSSTNPVTVDVRKH